jgi:hypothetical protein
MDDRSDAKGPEPECVTTGIMSDTGKRLAFVGVERTGGIYVYDVSTPAQSRFQDYLNVRNWRSGELNPATGALATSSTVAGTEVTYNLNDGPESLVFVSAADSPLGREMLLAATPLAGRLTAYIIERGPPRGNDGSCPNTASCPYLSTTVGGTGLYRNAAGKSTIDPCSICIGAACPRVGCGNPPPPRPLPPPAPSPPDVGYLPSTIAPNTQVTLSVLGSFASAGDTLVLLPAGTPDCTGAVYASSTTGGVVSAEYTLGVTIGVSGTYKTCISRRTRPTLDSHFDYLDGPSLVVSVQVLAGTATSPIQVLAQQVAELSANVVAQSSTLSTLSANVADQSVSVAALSGALQCGAGGRRLETDTDMSYAPSEPSGPSESTTAQAIVDDFLSRRPDLAMTLTAEQRAVIEDLGQHFGLPALA